MLGFGLHLAVSKCWISLVMTCLFLCVVVSQPMCAQFSGHLNYCAPFVCLLCVCVDASDNEFFGYLFCFLRFVW